MSHKHWKLVEEEGPAHGACPHCGACSCCGRGATPVVYPYTTQPWPWPYTVWSSTTTLSPFASGASGGFIGSASIVEVSS